MHTSPFFILTFSLLLCLIFEGNSSRPGSLSFVTEPGLWLVQKARRDSLSVGDEAPPFALRNLLTDEPVFLRDYTGKTLREAWKNNEIQRHATTLLTRERERG